MQIVTPRFTTPYIDARDYGLVPNSGSAQTAVFSALFDASATQNREIFLPAGTYICGQIAKSTVPRIRTNGPELVTIQADASYTAGNALWSFEGSLDTTLGTGGKITITNAKQGDFQIALSSTTGLSDGDYLLLADNTAPYSAQSTRFQGQTVRIYHVDSPTQVTLDDPVYAPLTSSPFAQKINMLGHGIIDGVRFTNSFATSLISALRLSYVSDLRVHTTGEGWGGAGLQLRAGYDCRLDHEAKDYYDQAITNLSQFGYGVSIGLHSAHVRVAVQAARVRHAVSIGGEDGQYGEPLDIRVTGEAHGCTSASWDAHAQGSMITFVNCHAYGGRGYGYQVRCQNVTISGGAVDNCIGGVWTFENAGKLNATGVRIANIPSNNLQALPAWPFDTTGGFNGAGGSTAGSAFRVQTAIAGLIIQDCDMENIAGCGVRIGSDITDGEVVRNRIRNVGLAQVSGETRAIRVIGNGTRAHFDYNIVADNQTSKTTLYASEFVGSTQTDVTFHGNTILNGITPSNTGAPGYAQVRVGTNWTSTAFVSGRVILTFSATPTFDASLARIQTLTLTGNVTSSTITNPVDGQELEIVLVQDATGGWTFTWPSNVRFPSGVAPTLQTAALARDTIRIRYDSAATNWYLVSLAQNTPLGTTTPAALATTAVAGTATTAAHADHVHSTTIGSNTAFGGLIVTAPPAPTVGAATSGGSLSPSTTFYYATTDGDGFGNESQISPQASGTTDTSNLTLPVTPTGVTGAPLIYMYRGTTSGSYTQRRTLTSAATVNDDGTGWTTISATPGPSSSSAYAWRQAAGTAGTSYVSRASGFSTDHGQVNWGDGIFDGATAGKFAGGAAGTFLAMNLRSGSTYDAFRIQKAGSDLFYGDTSGNLSIAGNFTPAGTMPAGKLTGTVPLASLSGITTSQLSATAGIVAGQLAVASPSSGQIGGLTTSNLSATAGIVAGQLAVSSPSSGQVGGLTTSNLSATAGIVAGQLAVSSPTSGQVGGLGGSNFANQSANTHLAGPTSGGAATSTFRALVAADLPLATTGAVGGVSVGGGLQVNGSGVLAAAPVTPQPGLENLLAYSVDPAFANSTVTPAAAQIRFVKMSVTPGQVISKIKVNVTNVGSAASGLWLVLYDTAGNLLARTADLTGSLATGELTGSIAADGSGNSISTYTIGSGVTAILVGVLVNSATTSITVTASSLNLANFGLVSGTDTLRSWSTSGGKTTTPPASISPTSGITASAGVVLFGLL